MVYQESELTVDLNIDKILAMDRREEIENETLYNKSETSITGSESSKLK